MNVVAFVLAGFCGGILGAMGLGGGSMMMPILTLCLGVPTKLASWLNLIAFLPVSSIAVVCHSKNGTILWREVLFCIVTAAVGASVAFIFGKSLSDRDLRCAFGWLLIGMGSLSLFFCLLGFFRNK